jgi:hypothetical protein
MDRVTRIMTGEPAPERCCTTMLTLSTPHAELMESLIRRGAMTEEEAATLSPHQPLVEWQPHLGMFCIQNVAISHCPWCGSRLPTPALPARSDAGLKPMQVFVSADGKVDVFVDGKPAPDDASPTGGGA